MKRVTTKLFGELSELVARLYGEGYSINQMISECRGRFAQDAIDDADLHDLIEGAAETWHRLQIYEPGDSRHTPNNSAVAKT